ncbi:MAG: response regulator [Candidatus Paceibacterota bacterium]
MINTAKDKSILVVEDESDIREAMAAAVKAAGYKAYTAENGEVGLKMALANKPDLILLDLEMPVMDGHAMLEKLRDDPWGHTARVVILSAMDDVMNVAAAHEGGITDYLIKSNSSLEDLINKIRIALHAKE